MLCLLVRYGKTIDLLATRFERKGRVYGAHTPVSPVRAMVREQMPLQASQKRISWSYDPVTRITDISWRGWFFCVAEAGILSQASSGDGELYSRQTVQVT